MARYRVVVDALAEPEFLSIPFPFRRQVNQRIQKLKSEPRPDSARIIGEGPGYRLDVAGWRVLYEVDDTQLLVSILGFRKVDEPS